MKGYAIVEGDVVKMLVPHEDRNQCITEWLICSGLNFDASQYPDDEELRDEWAALWAQGTRCVPMAFFIAGNDDAGPHAPANYTD